jgi:hypothetical protein
MCKLNILTVFLLSITPAASFAASLSDVAGLLDQCTTSAVKRSDGRLNARLDVGGAGAPVYFDKHTFNARGQSVNDFIYTLENQANIIGLYVSEFDDSIHVECSQKCVAVETTEYLDAGPQKKTRTTYNMPVAVCRSEAQAREIAEQVASALGKPVRY